MNDLKRAIKDKNVILFVGAGISATLELPTWSDLIAKMGQDLGYDAELFRQYGDNLILAEYYALTKGRIGELRSWMDENWKISKEKEYCLQQQRLKTSRTSLWSISRKTTSVKS